MIKRRNTSVKIIPLLRIILSVISAIFLFSGTIQAQIIVGLDSMYCTTDPVDTIYGQSPDTKDFSGLGITQITHFPKSYAIFDPSVAGPGIHQIYYFDKSWIVRVYEPLPVTLNPFDPVCLNDASFTLTGGSPSGGVYSVDGVDQTTPFNPATAGIGTHMVVYHRGPVGCMTFSSQQALEVKDVPSLVFHPLPNVCEDAPAITLDQALPAGGTYSGPGVTGNIFSPSVAGPGTHTLAYYYSDGTCDNTAYQTIKVAAIPPVSFSGADTMYCDTDPKVLLTGYPTDANGSFSGHGITDNGNGTAYFDPSTSGLGYHQITYQYSSPGGCSLSYTRQIRVGTLIRFSGLASKYCGDNPDVTFTYVPTGGTFNVVTGLTDNLDGTATLKPSMGSEGSRTIRYTYTDIYGCINKLEKDVQISLVPSANFIGLDGAGYCQNGDTVNLAGNQAPLGTFSGPGITDHGDGTAAFNPRELPTGGPYTVTYYYKDLATGCDNSASASTSVLSLPSASISGSQTVCPGDAASLNVDFTGTGPFSFSWSDSLSTNSVTNAGNPYTLVFTPSRNSKITIKSVTQANGCSNTGSGQGNVTVNPLAAIVHNPENKTSCPGDKITFTVSASGVGLSYQWMKDGSPMVGETNNVLIINSVTSSDAGGYTCVVNSTCGPPLTSSPGVLTVLPATVITDQSPLSNTECEGNNASFTVQASGSGLIYQWKKDGINLSDSSRISGTNTDNLVITDLSLSDGGVYTCTVTGDCGVENSDPVTLTVQQKIRLTAQPVSRSVCPGSTTSFAIVASGTGLSYQWKHDGADIPGAVNPALIITGVDSTDAGDYRCIVTGSCGSVSGDVATLSVYEPVSIDQQPQNVSTCEGLTADMNIIASGSDLYYRWYKDGDPLSNGDTISGADSPNLSVSGLTVTGAGGYVCEVTGSCGTVNSATGILVVDEPVHITHQPVTKMACAGENVIFTSPATGTNLFWQWYKDGSSLAGETAPSLVLSSVTSASEGNYYATITNACGPVSTNHAGLALNPVTTVVSQSPVAPVCEGENASFKVTATGADLTYQWMKDGAALNDSGNVSGCSTSSLLISDASVSDAGVYFCHVGGSCGTAGTIPATLRVHANTTILNQPKNKLACPGTNVSFGVTASGDDLHYQWQKEGIDLPGDTVNILSLSSVGAADEAMYHCVVNGVCGVGYSNSALLTVNEDVSISSNPPSPMVCEGNNVSFSVTASGTSLDYQWRRNGTPLIDSGRITGSTTKTLTIANAGLADQGVYSCNITGYCGSKNSLPGNLTVNPRTVVNTQPVTFEAVENGNASFSVSAGGAGLTYQWYHNGSSLSNDTVFNGVNTSILTLSGVNASHAGSYYCIVNGTCGTVTSDPGELIVNLLTLITAHPSGPLTKCVNESAAFDVIANGTNLVYQWMKDGANLADDERITGAKTANLRISSVVKEDEGSYSCLVTGDEGIENSFPAELSVNALTDITLQPLNASKCEGDDALFVITTEGNITSYRWRKDGTDLTDDLRITGSGTSVLSVPGVTVADSGVYTCYVEGVCANDVSNPATLKVDQNTLITSQPSLKTRCAGGSATFSVQAEGGDLTYRWKKDGIDLHNGGAVSGARSPDLTLINLSQADEGGYTCLVTGACGAENSARASLTVSPETFITDLIVDKVKCEGDDAFFMVKAEGQNLNYEWRKDGTALTDDDHLTGSSLSTLSITGLLPEDEGTYQVYVTGSCGTYLSDPAHLTVNHDVRILNQPTGEGRCEGESITLSIVTESNSDRFQWKKDGNILGDSGHYSGTTTPHLTISDLDASGAGVYACLVTGLCNSKSSVLAPVAVKPETRINVQPVSQSADEGNPVSFTVSATGDSLNWQWFKDGVGLTDSMSIGGTTTEVLTISSVAETNSGSYTAVVAGSCESVVSDPAILTVNSPTLITRQPEDHLLCEGEAAVFSVAASGTGLTYQWLKKGSPLSDITGKVTGSNTANLSVSSVDSSDNGTYYCRITGGGGVANSHTAILTVSASTRLINAPVSSQLKCAGENTYYSVVALGDSLTYSWEKDGSPLINGGNVLGAQSDILTVQSVSTSDQGVYRCFISGTCGDVSTGPSNLTVRELPGNPGLISGDDNVCQGEHTKAYEIPVLSNTSSYEWTLPYGAEIAGGAGSRYVVIDYDSDAMGGAVTVHGRNECGIGPESAPMTVTVNTRPVANAGFDQNVCSSTTVLGAQCASGGTWSRVAGFADFAAPDQCNTTVSNLGQGANVLVWTVTQNGCTSRDTVVVVNNRVNVDAGQDQVLCGLTTTLDGSAVTKGIGQWSIQSGGANFLSFNDPKTGVINVQRGTNVLKWSVNNNGCISSDTVKIMNDLPTNAVAGSDTIILTDTYTFAGNTPAIGTGQWSLVSGVGVIQNPGSATSTVSHLGIGENIFKWTITNQSCYSEDEIKVINYTPTINNAGPDQTLCTGRTVLSGTPPNYGTGQWTIVQGSGSFANASKYDTEIYNLGKGENVFRWTIYEYEITFDDVKITNNAPSSANAGIDQRLCTDRSVLSANVPLVGTGQWTIAGGSATIGDDKAANTTVANLSNGSNTFRWTITNGTCSSSDEVTVINDQPTPSSAGVDQTTCADSVNLYPNTPTVGSGEWSVISGSGYFVDNRAYGLGVGTNQYKWTISHNGCQSSDTVSITSHKPTTAFLTPSKSICTDSICLPGNMPQFGSGTWTILSGSANISDPSDPTALATDLAQGQNKFRWTIQYEECSSFADITVGYDLVKAGAGTDQVLCEDVAIMGANTPSAGAGLWTIVGGSGSANFANPDKPNTQVTGLDRGENILRWTITNHGCTSYDEVTITNNNPGTAYAGADRSVCGEKFALNANRPLIGNGEWSVLSGSANIANPTLSNSEVTNLSLGKNTLRWTVTNLGCSSSDEVIIYNDQPTNISAGTDQYICADSTQLYSSDPAEGTGRWSIASGSASFNDNTVFNTRVFNLEKGENKLVWTVTINGCSNNDTVTITNNLPSLPSAGPDQDNCASETFMAANIPQIGTGKWSVVSGSAIFEDPANPLTRIMNAGNGINLLRWTITNGNCNLSDDVNIINSLPTLAYAGEDRAVCNNSANLLANPPTTGTGTWKVVSGYGVIENPHDYNTQIDNLGFGQNTIRWTTENGRCKTSDDVIVTNNLAEVFAGSDEIVYSPAVTLVGNRPSSGTGEWKLVAGSGTLETPGNFETGVMNLGEGANTFNWTIDNQGCIANDDVVITYYVLPDVDFTPSPQNGCPPLTVDFINGSVGGNPFSWDFGDGSASSEINPMHTYTIPGKYKVTLTGTGPDGIMITSDTTIIVREKPDAEMQVTPSLIYISDPPDELDDPVHFFTLTEEVDSVIWDFGDGTISNEMNPVHRYRETGTYDINLQVYTGYQCSDDESMMDAITVERKGSINCPNAFTPNLQGPLGGVVSTNDYSNDVFHCYAEGLLEYHLAVYNRLGILLFESDDVNVGWDGYFQGKLAEEGVYVYQVSGIFNNGEKFSHIGSVVLIH